MLQIHKVMLVRNNEKKYIIKKTVKANTQAITKRRAKGCCTQKGVVCCLNKNNAERLIVAIYFCTSKWSIVLL